MKKTLLIIPIALMCITSCVDDKGSDTITSFDARQLNLVTCDDNSEEPKIEQSYYSFRMNMAQRNLDISCTDFPVGGQKITFSATNVPFTQNMVNYKFNTSVLMSQSASVTGMSAELAINANVPPNASTGEVSFGAVYQLIARYYIDGKYTVHTFPLDATYTGYTECGDFKDNTPFYRFRIDPAKMTATAYVYRFSVSDKMPVVTFSIPDLKVVPGYGSYTIEGTDVVPLQDGTVPMEAFKFDSFKFTTLGADLTTGKIETKVAGQYDVTFQGSYLYKIQ